jgi:enoyl-CoA hydratase/carnithine racemase
MPKVLVEIAGAVRTVTLNRADKRNALDVEMMAELTAAMREPPGAEERVAVIRAAGTVFCSGLDLRARREIQADGISSIEDCLAAIESYPLPVVAIVQGDAIAGGNELALHCDIVVASNAARFGMPLAQLGLTTSWFLTKKLIEVAGPVATRKILLLGEFLTAAEMQALGAIAEVVPPGALETRARAVIDRLAANAPLSLKAMKALIVRQMTFRDALPHADLDAIASEVSRSEDGAEGSAAKLEKRRPVFKGR